MKIRVKYCGGCNPNYDRVRLVETLKEKLKGFASIIEEGDAPLVIVVAGCATACVDLTPFKKKQLYVITSPDEAFRLVRSLTSC